MKSVVSTEALRGPAGDFILASVTGSEGLMGVCDTSTKKGVCRKTLYAGAECLVNVQYRENDEESNRIIWQHSSIDKAKSITGNRLTKSCEAYFAGVIPLSKAVVPVLEMFPNGLYVAHTGKVFPTDGAGNFFWDAYTVRHEIYGSAPYNQLVGDRKCYSPPFLIPTLDFSGYSEANIGAAAEKLSNGKKLGGIAFHMSGMFSALLEGHTNAAACVANDMDFNCIIIEPLNQVIYGENGDINEKKVTALSCPFVKLPIEDLSRSMIENFLLNRRVYIPREFEEIKLRAEKPSKGRSAYMGKRVNNSIERNAEGLPDAEMMYSAFAIDDLSDEQVQVLLNGQTEIDGKVIISPNYYESLTYAANYLQLKSRRRFIDFAQAVLINPDLSPVYVYIVGRLKYIMDAKVNEIFRSIVESSDAIYDPVRAVAENYLKLYTEFSEVNVKRFLNSSMSGGSPSPSMSSLRSSERSAADALIEFAGNRRGGSGAVSPEPAPEGEKTLSSLELSKQIKNAAQ